MVVMSTTTSRTRRPHPARLARQVAGAGSVAGLLLITGCMANGAADQGASSTAATDDQPILELDGQVWDEGLDDPVTATEAPTSAPATTATTAAPTTTATTAAPATAAPAPATAAAPATAPAQVAPRATAATRPATNARPAGGARAARPSAPGGSAGSSSHGS